MPTEKVKRYWPGKAPQAVSSDSENGSGSDDAKGDDRTAANDKLPRDLSPARPRRPRQVEKAAVLDAGDDDEDNDEVEARRARLRLRKRRDEEEEEGEELPFEDDESIEGPAELDEDKGRTGASESSEYETVSTDGSGSGDDGGFGAPKWVRPVFVPKSERTTVQEREEMDAREEDRLEREKKRRNEQVAETRAVIAQTVKEEVDAEALEGEFEKGLVLPDDTDGAADLEEEREKWKLREIRRVQREEEAQERHDAADEAERFRNLPKEEQDRLLRERLDDDEKARRSKTKLNFMQKYYHKGAFFMDTDESGKIKEDVYRRNFNEATEEDGFDKTLLPKPMQVRRGQLHMSGRSKYTHLADQDTTTGTTYGNKVQTLGKDDVLPGNLLQRHPRNSGAGDFERPRGAKRSRKD